MAAHQIRLMNFHALGRYAEAAAESRVVLADHGPELAQHYVQPGWAAIPIINLYAFYASTLSRLGQYEGAEEACAQAYKILATVNHPYSRLLIDYVQGQIWIEKEELEKAETLLRGAVQRCLVHKVPTMLAVCIGTLGSALARNGKASEAVVLLEKGFADGICNAAGHYGKIFMRVSLGVAYRDLGRLEEAVSAGRQAVDQAGEEYGHRTEALYELAETLSRAGDASGATRCFTQTYEAARRLGMPYYEKRAAAALATPTRDWHVA
jgi:tetratricopeptide (TPR) repeat protein